MKKLLAICLAVMLVVAMIPVIAVYADNTPTIKVSSAEAKAGETVDVAITLENNPGIVSAKLLATYDANVLELVGKANGETFVGMAYSPDDANPFFANWVDSIHPNNETNGTFVTLTFKVKDGAAIGESAITVTYDPEDVYNSDWDNVEFAIENGAVNVLDCAHENTTETKEDEVVLTCTQDASYVKVVTCNDCGKEVSRETVVTETAKGHDFAADNKCSVCGESRFTGPTIYVEGGSALAGETVDVKINLAKNPGIVSAKLLATYDANVLELVGKVNGEAFTGMAYSPDDANPFFANWVDSIHPNNETNGTFVTLTFKIKDGAALGDSAITVTYDPEDVYNSDWDNVEFAIENGAVTVIDCQHANTTETKENEKELTCTQDASYEKVVTCNDCGVELSRETVVVTAAEGHKEELVGAKAAACGVAGYTGDKVCSVCEEVLEKGSEIAALEHVAGEAKVENASDATCGQAGSYDSVVYCTVCNAELSRETVNVDALPHTAAAAVKENEVAATCTEAGSYDNVVYCSVCKAELSRDTVTVDALGHTAAEAVKENEVAATCTEAGSYDNVVYCLVCNVELSREKATVDALGHTEAAELANVKEATCIEAGYTGDKVCSVCGEVLEAGSEIDMIAHNFKAVEKVDATCAAEGMEAHFACDAGCGQLAADEDGAEIVKAEDLAIAKVPHNIGKVEGAAATTEKDGVKEHFACSECDALFADAEGKTELKAEDVVIPAIKVEEPKEEDKPATDTPATDKPAEDKAPQTGDVANVFVMVAMLMAVVAASVVVLKKKA